MDGKREKRVYEEREKNVGGRNEKRMFWFLLLLLFLSISHLSRLVEHFFLNLFLFYSLLPIFMSTENKRQTVSQT